uniref:Uncharacterized protein n=1 Tax=Siphoviridae sp. ctrCN24 TaxID=2827953 RepID=A0A8S5SK75_9CAUD|nr:MAG TPA: hypothetical protein [Siphoviridae sp. ctrCN24]
MQPDGRTRVAKNTLTALLFDEISEQLFFYIFFEKGIDKWNCI